MKKFFYILVAMAIVGLSSCENNEQGYNDGTPITETTWQCVETFYLPMSSDWLDTNNYINVSLVSEITFYDSTSGQLTLSIPGALPTIFTLDFDFTFNGAEGVISCGYYRTTQFDFKRTSSTTLSMTLPAELLDSLDLVSDISDLEGGGITLTLTKTDFVARVTPYTDVTLQGSLWDKSMIVSVLGEELSYYYSLNFTTAQGGTFTTRTVERYGEDSTVNYMAVPFVYTQTTSATGTITVPDALEAIYRIEGRTLWFSTGSEGEGFATEVPLMYVEQ